MSRRLLILLAVLSLLLCAPLVHRAIQLFRDPFPASRTNAPHWFDEVLGVVWYATIFVACVVYELRRMKCPQQETKIQPTLWRHRPELRVVLYCLAAIQFAQIPIGVFRAVQASRIQSPPWDTTTFWSAFPLDSLLYAAFGFAIIAYDRHRMLQDRKPAGECMKCGYDLRATPDRCPECGSPIPQITNNK